MTESFSIIPITATAQQLASDFRAPDAGRNYPDTLWDDLHRPLRELRISVTDRCNLRCTYCMPREIFDDTYTFLSRSALLSFEEIERLARLFVWMGVRKIRLTGGEPLLRRRVERLIEKLARLQTMEGKPLEIALTTNGVLLARKAQSLKAAGLSRVTVSLDGLSDATFRRMSDTDVSVATVMEGIDAARVAGLGPVKINMVIKRGVNEHEILSMAEHFRHTGMILRFIEFMDVGCTNGWRMDDVVPASAILDRISKRHPLERVGSGHGGEVAKRWRYADGGGEIGVIAAVTQAFCQECSRARLSTDGKLYTCLFASEGLDLCSLMRKGTNDRMLAKVIAHQWRLRNDHHSQLRHLSAIQTDGRIEMSYIGG